jgi:hypothetical protein
MWVRAGLDMSRGVALVVVCVFLFFGVLLLDKHITDQALLDCLELGHAPTVCDDILEP